MKIESLPIYLLSDEKKEGVKNYPVIKIDFLTPEVSFEGIDYLIFTSKNGVRAIDRINDMWKNIPALAIGKATANEIKARGGKVEYIAKKAYGDEFAKEINQKYSNKKFLFLRAKKIISDIAGAFKDSSNTLIEKIVYETKCNKPDAYIKKPAFVIFSSPSTVECFIENEDMENIIPIAIGKKTLKALKDKGINSYLMPNKPSIDECIKLINAAKFKALK
ncbi:MAG: uroporphyrinogen-III synthase [Epsilonproteobacteria bacterium]|nr:uroporphyrinogen-III synthase [Campylobacterota bacterium]